MLCGSAKKQKKKIVISPAWTSSLNSRLIYPILYLTSPPGCLMGISNLSPPSSSCTSHFHPYNLAPVEVIPISVNGNCIFPSLPTKNLRAIHPSLNPVSSLTGNSLGSFKMCLKFLISSVVNAIVQATIISSLDDYNSPLTLLSASTPVPCVSSPHSRYSHALKTFIRSHYSSFHSAQILTLSFKVLHDLPAACPQVISWRTTTFLSSSPTTFPLTMLH